MLGSGNYGKLCEEGLVYSCSSKSVSYSCLPCYALHVMLLSCLVVAMVAMVAPSLYPTTYLSRQLRTTFFFRFLNYNKHTFFYGTSIFWPYATSYRLYFPLISFGSLLHGEGESSYGFPNVSFGLTLEYLSNSHDTTSPTQIVLVCQLLLTGLQS
jgi:hypothetical protein